MQQMKKIMDPTVDFAFKQIFGQDTKECKKILLHLLNSTFERVGSKRINEITYINTHIDRQYEKDKESIMDVGVKTEDDELIDIEMQVGGAYTYRKRAVFNCANMFGGQINKGELYDLLKRCVCVSILNFNLITETEDFHTVFEVKERRRNFILSNDLEWHFIEISKLSEFEGLNVDTHEMDYLQKWALFFKFATSEDMRWLVEQLRQEVEEIGMASEILERVSQDERAWFAYIARRKEVMDKASADNKIKEKDAKLLEKDSMLKEKDSMLMEKDSMLKEKDSMLKEKDSMLMEKDNQLKQIVKSLFQKGMNIEFIKQCTALSQDEILKIQQEDQED